MSKTRVEAFTDGVMAILITIMVLELRTPHGTDVDSLLGILPELAIYALSFTMLGIYWNNHHHMLHATERVNGAVLWANLHLLFWLSLMPFVTGWMGEHHFAPLPTVVYGVVQFCAAIAYTILQTAIIRLEGPHSKLAVAVKKDVKGKLSVVLWFVAIPLAFVQTWIALALYIAVAGIWLVPDRRIERTLPRNS